MAPDNILTCRYHTCDNVPDVRESPRNRISVLGKNVHCPGNRKK